MTAKMAAKKISARASRRMNPPPAVGLVVRDKIARIRIDLPGEKLNVLRLSVVRELERRVAALSAVDSIKCLVLESGKPGVFVAGADLKEFASVSGAKEASEMSRIGQEVLNTIEDLPFPTVALVDGAALGGGLELAMACDYRLVTDGPKTLLGLPEVTLGIVPGFGGTYRLPRLVGLAAAVRMTLTGKPVTGVRAAGMGLADACWPAGYFKDRAEAFIARLAAGGGEKKSGRRRRRGRGALPRFLLEGNPLGRALLFRAAAGQARRKAGAHYPAPGEALRVLRASTHADRERAMALEREAVGRLLPSRVSRNLVGLFLAREAAKKLPDQPKASRFAFLARLRERAPQRPRRAAVVGAGVMGGRIAWLFTRNGIPVAMKDVSWDAVLKGYQTAYRVYEELAGRGRVDGREIGLSMHRLSGMVDYEGLGNPDLVIEAVVENLGVKKEVLAELESRVRADAILASNTSSLSITEMAAGLREPGRLVGMHFFNPPNLMPLVEIVPGRLTTERTVLGARVAALALGKTPIVVRDSPGFLVNRLLMSYLNECLLLPLEGLDYREVDAMAVRFGMPMGPFALLDEIGLDVAREVARSLHEAYGGRMGRDGLFDALKGRPDLLGRKSGKGFYLYRGVGKRTANPEMRGIVSSLRDGARGRDAMSAFDALHRSLMAMVNEAARALEEGVVDSAERLDLALVLGIGFPPFRGGLLRYADELGAGNVLESLLRYERRFGERFAPAPLIEKLAKGKSGFYAAR